MATTSTKPKSPKRRRHYVKRSNKTTKESIVKNLKEVFVTGGLAYGGAFSSLNADTIGKLREAMIEVARDEDFWTAIKQMYGHYELAREISKSLKGSK